MAVTYRTIGEVAEEKGVSRETIRRKVLSGELPAMQPAGPRGDWMIIKSGSPDPEDNEEAVSLTS
jgi:excisionase family DNA binding protein